VKALESKPVPGTICVDTDSTYAPCSYLICRVRPDGTYSTRDEANTVLVQTDWDYPALASTFGWRAGNTGREDPDTWEDLPDCQCWQHTDGTVDCPACGKTAAEFITEAAEFLDSCSDFVEDPGYFEE